MSGGHFDYNQRKIKDICEKLDKLIENNGKKMDEEELREYLGYSYRQDIKTHPELAFRHKYPKHIVEEFKKGLYYANRAYIYAQRIDWLVSDDDGEESFLERLKMDLEELE